jgi:LDH2 family malate/lactate/ureidoglycolate dehydrogenase
MDDMICQLHLTPTLPGEEGVLVAGDPEADATADRLVNGVPVENGNYAGIKARAVDVGTDVVI